ncbi:MAG: NUDIX hydrolase [Rhizobiaceae bacterium]|nr:NUDIX hydrolase [Rhizobiaceae bacterium]
MIYPRIAASCVLKRGNRYLMVRRAHGQAAGDYAFPGGKVEPGELLAEAALRELREETGIKAYNPRFFRFYDLIERNAAGLLTSHYVLAVHLADTDDEQRAVAADDALEAAWYTAAEIRALPTPASVLECIEHFEAHGLRPA